MGGVQAVVTELPGLNYRIVRVRKLRHHRRVSGSTTSYRRFSDPAIDKLLEETRKDPEAKITVDLETRTVEGPGVSESFEMDDFTRHRLLNGLDDIGLTLTYEDELERFESTRLGCRLKVSQG